MKKYLFLVASIVACGGGASEPFPDTRVVKFHGELKEGSFVTNSAVTPYIDYKICAFGQCDNTNAEGEYAFTAVLPAQGISTEMTASGPNFDTEFDVTIPAGVKDMDIDVIRESSSGQTKPAKVVLDGVEDPTQSVSGGFNDGD